MRVCFWCRVSVRGLREMLARMGPDVEMWRSTSGDQNTHVIFCTGHVKLLNYGKKLAKVDKEVENKVLKSSIT